MDIERQNFINECKTEIANCKHIFMEGWTRMDNGIYFTKLVCDCGYKNYFYGIDPIN